MKQYVFVGLGLFVASAVMSALVYVFIPKYELVIQNQSAGTTVFINRLVLPTSGYIAVEPFTIEDGFLGDVITSDYMPAGVYTDLYVDLMDIELKTKPGMVLYIRILKDNGDAYLDQDLDKPVRWWYGKELYKRIILL
jgi:hypothetical protein